MAEKKPEVEPEEDVKLLAKMFRDTRKFVKVGEEEETEEGKEVS